MKYSKSEIKEMVRKEIQEAKIKVPGDYKNDTSSYNFGGGVQLLIRDNPPNYDSAKGEFRYGNQTIFSFEIPIVDKTRLKINPIGVNSKAIETLIKDLGWLD